MIAGARRAAAFAAGAITGFTASRRLIRRSTAWRLDDRVAIVTGGSRGLGLLIARELLRAGCRVAICGREPTTVDRAARQLGHGDRLLALRCDVGDRADAERLVEEVRVRFGRIDLLITNASTISVGRLETMNAEHFEAALHDTFQGTLYPILAVLPEMRARRDGRIAIIGSIGGRVAFPHLLPYTAAKYAQVGLSEGLRAELAADGIGVTTIIPGFMRTGSFLAADFHDPAPEEYGWFAAGASVPVLTLSPEWAARRIVQAIRLGEADVTLGWFARAGGALKSLFPGLSADILGLVDRWVLPSGASGTTAPHMRGDEVHPAAPALTKDVAAPVIEDATTEMNQPPPAD